MPFGKVHPLNPEPDIILAAANIIRQGGVVVFPTRSLYGLAADALNPEAVDRIFRIKQRSSSKPLLIMIKNKSELSNIVREVPPAAECFMTHFWPGKLTIVLDAAGTLPKNLTGGTGKIGIRLPGHPVAFSLVSALENPVTGTSANISGKPGCSKVSDLDDAIIRKVDGLLDAGELEKGIGSTVIEVTNTAATLLREGGISASEIVSVLSEMKGSSVAVTLTTKIIRNINTLEKR
jgi:L-threonylcarbamoyladenylate synthase